MSVASAIFEDSADVLAIVHDDDLRLQPANVLVRGYAEELAEVKTGNRLNSSEMIPTHRLHVRRSQLVGVTVGNVASVQFGGKSYRVHTITDDPIHPEISFHCTLA
jgi:hypothetical protein